MAEADPQPPRRRAKALPLPDQVALVLQGGGALGSYQAGVIEGLSESGIAIDWVAGISIGAVNAAIVAGNSPERRMERLRAWWELVSSSLPSMPMPFDDRLREWTSLASAGWVLSAGVPGFFGPRWLPPQFAPPGTMEAMSFYDTTPLRETLDSLIDWDLLNDGPMRFSVGAVDVESGNLHYFDNRAQRIDARHIMASGALPPGLPPIEIDGRWWWDGGLVSNTPLGHVLDNQTGAMLAFQVDLFPAEGERPRVIADVMSRAQDIRFSSRTRQVTDRLLVQRRDQAAIRKVLRKLPAELRDDPDVRELTVRAAEQPVSLVHLIYRARAWEGGHRDFEFSAATMREHWSAGRLAVDQTMANAELVARNILDGRTAAFDLSR